MRANRRVKSQGTITFRSRIPGGIFTRTTSAAPNTTAQIWLGWMLDNPQLASGTRLENLVVEEHNRLERIVSK